MTFDVLQALEMTFLFDKGISSCIKGHFFYLP